MGKDSKIEWTIHTFNPWRGCTKVAAGCAHCYADKQAKRNPSTLGIWGNDGTRVLASDAMWREPIKWNKAAACDCHARQDLGERHLHSCPQSNRPRVFCASMADVFEDWQGEIRNHSGRVLHRCSAGHILPLESVWVNGIECDAGCTLLAHPLTMDDARSDLFKLIDATPNLDWLLLTKRPENISRMWCSHVNTDGMPPSKLRRKNVWLGTSIATQEDADKNIPELLKCRDLSPVLFVSAEPLLGPVDIVPFVGGHSYHCAKCNDWKRTEIEMAYTGGGSHSCVKCGTYCPAGPTLVWLIVGGESGPSARPMHPAWARSLRDQCQAAGVPFFFKQWGEWIGGKFDDRKHKMVCDSAISGETVGQIYWTNPGEPSVHKWEMIDHYWRHASACVGKKAAGRLLDGREWNEFPRVESR
jgi:protein gp37